MLLSIIFPPTTCASISIEPSGVIGSTISILSHQNLIISSVAPLGVNEVIGSIDHFNITNEAALW